MKREGLMSVEMNGTKLEVTWLKFDYRIKSPPKEEDPEKDGEDKGDKVDGDKDKTWEGDGSKAEGIAKFFIRPSSQKPALYARHEFPFHLQKGQCVVSTKSNVSFRKKTT